MPRIVAVNNFEAELVNGITADQTSFKISTTDGLPTLGANEVMRFTIDAEVIEVATIDKINKELKDMIRGVEGVAAPHDAGGKVRNLWTAGTYAKLVDREAFEDELDAKADFAHDHTGAGETPVPLAGIADAAKTTPGGTEPN